MPSLMMPRGISYERRPLSFRQLYSKLLAGLAAAVDDVAVGEIRLAQIRHIYETHAPEQETEHEHVAGVVESGMQR